MSEIFDTDLLVSFLAVVDNRGFSAAARQINSTQATVSAKVGRLEQQAGHRLLERNKRGLLSVTREGEIIERMAREVLRFQAIARRRLEDEPMSGTVRVGMSDDFASGRSLTSVLGAFAARHPSVRLEVTVSNGYGLLKSLEKGHLDYVLCKAEDGFPEGATELWRERLIWVRGETALLPETGEVRLVTFDPPCCYRLRAMEALKRENRPWRVVYVSPSLAGVRAALSAGLGVTLLPVSLVTDDMRSMAEDLLPSAGMVSFGFHRRPGIETSAGIMFGELLGKLQSRSMPISVESCR
jgi:DNA-binding transcriptional LysR family regulator